MSKLHVTLLLVCVAIMSVTSLSSTAQPQIPEVIIRPKQITGLQGLQAYAFGTYNGKWVLIGGRTDGLHLRQASSSFSATGNNQQIYVVDPVANQVWTASVTSLPTNLKEQLQSTNMQFAQVDTILYLTGGYGYSASNNNHITYPYITSVHLPSLVNAIQNGTGISASFLQLNHSFMAVTGGRMGYMNGTFYLAGGNKFDGRYNPMGGPSYTQVYTNAVRKFRVSESGSTIVVSDTASYRDALQLHRRDYNMLPQVYPDGRLGYTMFSGVFQPTVDLPYLNCVEFDDAGFTPNNSFSQYLNHYHCATVPLYDENNNQMHSFFFGGISQYYVSTGGTVVSDNNVPFVNTIACVTRTNDSVLTETKLDITMPSLLGASSEFILAHNIPVYGNEVINYSQLQSDTNLIGYIYGGIASSAANIFTTNTGTQSGATSNVYEVLIVKSPITGGTTIKSEPTFKFSVVGYNNTKLIIKGEGEVMQPAMITVQNMMGEIVVQEAITNTKYHGNKWSFEVPVNLANGMYIVSMSNGQKIQSQKTIIQ